MPKNSAAVARGAGLNERGDVIRRLIAALAVFVASLVVGTVPAGAITNGQPDGDNHPYVGLAVFDVINPATQQQVPSHRCSASLLSPTVVLTAAHCTTGTVAARVWFDEDSRLTRSIPSAAQPPTTATPRRTRLSATRAEAVSTSSHWVTWGSSSCRAGPFAAVGEYADLPAAGLVDTLKNKSGVDFVGYGVQFQRQIPGNACRNHRRSSAGRAHASASLLPASPRGELHTERPAHEVRAEPGWRLRRNLLRRLGGPRPARWDGYRARGELVRHERELQRRGVLIPCRRSRDTQLDQ